MSERTFSTFEEASAFASLMKKLCGQDMIVLQQGAVWVVGPRFRQQTIVEVTEALLRQLSK